MFHKHKWVQIRDVFIRDNKKPDIIRGIFLFCEKCHAVCAVSLENCPGWSYSRESKDKK